MKNFFCLLVFISAPAFAANGAEQCLGYGSNIFLQGKLTRQTFAEQPNYESLAKGDVQASYFFLSPSPSICIHGKGEDGEQAEDNVKIVQLVFSGDTKMFESLRPYLGKTVRCRGNFFHAISGHHHSRVLLETSTCMPV